MGPGESPGSQSSAVRNYNLKYPSFSMAFYVYINFSLQINKTNNLLLSDVADTVWFSVPLNISNTRRPYISAPLEMVAPRHTCCSSTHSPVLFNQPSSLQIVQVRLGRQRRTFKETRSRFLQALVPFLLPSTRSGSVLVMALDLRLKDRGFHSQPFHFQVATLRKLFMHEPLSPNSIIW